MNDLDALLKEFEQPKENLNTQAQPSKPNKQPSGFLFDTPPAQAKVSKYDSSSSDNRKPSIPLFSNSNVGAEQRRTSILKQPPKPAIDQSLDIEAILQGRAIQPQQPPSKLLQPIAPTNRSASSTEDSLVDWLNSDRVLAKAPAQKATTTKANINLNPDDFFSNASNNRNQNETKPPLSTTKTSAKEHYLRNSRYKPGKTYLLHSTQERKHEYLRLLDDIGINPRQTTRRDSFNWLADTSSNSNSASV